MPDRHVIFDRAALEFPVMKKRPEFLTKNTGGKWRLALPQGRDDAFISVPPILGGNGMPAVTCSPYNCLFELFLIHPSIECE